MPNFETDLINYLPESWRKPENQSPDLEKVLRVIGKELNKIYSSIDSFSEESNPILAPSENLDIIAEGLNTIVNKKVNENFNRRQLFRAVETFKLKGTIKTLDLLLLDLGIQSTIEQLWTNDYSDDDFFISEAIPGGGYYRTSHFKIDVEPNEEFDGTSESIALFQELVENVVPINIVITVSVILSADPVDIGFQTIGIIKPIITGGIEEVLVQLGDILYEDIDVTWPPLIYNSLFIVDTLQINANDLANYQTLLGNVYDDVISYQNELDWLKEYGANAGLTHVEDAWQEVFISKDLWLGNHNDSFIAWLQEQTGLVSSDPIVLIDSALTNNWWDFQSFGELVQWSFNASKFNETGTLRSFKGEIRDIESNPLVYNFDGTNYIIYNNSHVPEVKTISFWMNKSHIDSSTTGQTILNFKDTYNGGLACGAVSSLISDETLTLYQYNSRAYIKDEIPVGWHHYFITNDGAGNYLFYIDGSAKTMFYHGIQTLIDINTNKLRLGRRDDGAQPLNNPTEISDVRIYDETVPISEIFNISTGRFPAYNLVLHEPCKDINLGSSNGSLKGTKYSWASNNLVLDTLFPLSLRNLYGYNEVKNYNGSSSWTNANYLAPHLIAATESFEFELLYLLRDYTGDPCILGVNRGSGLNNFLFIFNNTLDSLVWHKGSSGSNESFSFKPLLNTLYKFRVFADMSTGIATFYVNDVLRYTSNNLSLASDTDDPDYVSFGMEYDSGLSKGNWHNGYQKWLSFKTDNIERLDPNQEIATDVSLEIIDPINNEFDYLGQPLENGKVNYPAQAEAFCIKGDGSTIKGKVTFPTTAWDWNDLKFKTQCELLAHITETQRLVYAVDGSNENGWIFEILRADHPTYPSTANLIIYDGSGNSYSRCFPLPTHGVEAEYKWNGSTITCTHNGVVVASTYSPSSDTITSFTPTYDVDIAHSGNSLLFRGFLHDLWFGKESIGEYKHYFPMLEGLTSIYMDVIGKEIFIEMEGITAVGSEFNYTENCSFYHLFKGFNKGYLSNGINNSFYFDNIQIALGKQLELSDTLVIKFNYHVINKTDLPDGSGELKNIIWALDENNIGTVPEIIRVGHWDDNGQLNIIDNSPLQWGTDQYDEGIWEHILTFNNDQIDITINKLDGSEADSISNRVPSTTMISKDLGFYLLGKPSGSPSNIIDEPHSWASMPHVTFNSVDITEAFWERLNLSGAPKEIMILSDYNDQTKDVYSNDITYPNNGKLNTDQVRMNFNKENAPELRNLPSDYIRGNTFDDFNYSQKRERFIGVHNIPDSEDRFMFDLLDDFTNVPNFNNHVADA